MQITDLIRDSPLRDLGTVLSQCTHVIVPRDEEDNSFEYDPEEEVPIGGRDDDDDTDEDYEPEEDDGSAGLGVSDRERVGVKRVRGHLVWLWIGRVIKKGRVKFGRNGG